MTYTIPEKEPIEYNELTKTIEAITASLNHWEYIYTALRKSKDYSFTLKDDPYPWIEIKVTEHYYYKLYYTSTDCNLCKFYKDNCDNCVLTKMFNKSCLHANSSWAKFIESITLNGDKITQNIIFAASRMVEDLIKTLSYYTQLAQLQDK